MTKPKNETNDDEIVDSSINTDTNGAEYHAPGNDDRSWVETVVTSFSERSPAAKQALMEALLDSQTDAMPLLAPFTCSQAFLKVC